MLLARLFILATCLLPLNALAEQGSIAQEGWLQPQFMFKHQTFSTGQLGESYQYGDEPSMPQGLHFDRNSPLTGRMKQYDATIAYPLRQSSFNVDLGVNLRFLEGDFVNQNQPLAQNAYHINTALPLLYANALFDLPFEGLSASFGASHADYDDYYVLDYEAKLSYSWQNGFGLEGGWQHQQLNIDANDLQAQFENKGPFLDFKYRF